MCDPPLDTRGACASAHDGRSRSRGSASPRRPRSTTSSLRASSRSRRIRTPTACASARSTPARARRCRSSAARRTPPRACSRRWRVEGATLPGGRRDQARDDARRANRSGMLCSAKELGLDEDATRPAGLLDASLAPGTPLRDALDARRHADHAQAHAEPRRLPVDSRHRARGRGDHRRAAVALPQVAATPGHSRRRSRRVRVDDSGSVPPLRGRVIEGIDPHAPTPAWMKQRLERSGIRSISAVVDITNYVMLELGQPLHAYDDALLDGAIVVRFADDGEKLTAAQRRRRSTSTADLLLVCRREEAARPRRHHGRRAFGHRRRHDARVARRRVLESRRRSRARCGASASRATPAIASSAASTSSGCARAVERATQLILEICGGRAGPLTDESHRRVCPARAPVRVRRARVARLLGVAIADDADRRRLRAPGLRRSRANGERLRRHAAVVPLRPRDRGRLRRGSRAHPRLRQRFPRAPRAHVDRMLPDPEDATSASRDSRARSSPATGRRSSRSASSTSAIGARARSARRVRSRVLNPIAAHLDVMRTSLLPGLIETLRTNVNRKQARVRMFEVGRVFRAREQPTTTQPLRVGGLAFGAALPEQWGEAGARRRLLRREGRPRSAGRAARADDRARSRTLRCIRAAPRA